MNNKIKLVLSLIIIVIALMATSVQAGYQSIPDKTTTEYSHTWLGRIREIEAPGSGMGLEESINSSTLIATTNSNNIDAHMVKNSEWGAMAILSASNYGKQGTGSERYVHKAENGKLATTTGNEYGICNIGSSGEWVAAGYNRNLLYSSADNRYKEAYDSSRVSSIKGDAMDETTSGLYNSSGSSVTVGSTEYYNNYYTYSWHSGSGRSNWVPSWKYNASKGTIEYNYSFYGYYRGSSGVFQFGRGIQYGTEYSSSYSVSGEKKYSRAVVVSGNGF